MDSSNEWCSSPNDFDDVWMSFTCPSGQECGETIEFEHTEYEDTQVNDIEISWDKG